VYSAKTDLELKSVVNAPVSLNNSFIDSPN
jgi:hypothetical protein